MKIENTRIVKVVLLAFLMMPFMAFGGATIELWGTRLDPSRAAVVLPDEPTISERTAAADLTNHLAKITGKVFPIVAEKSFKRQQGLYVGATKFAAKNGVNVAALGDEKLHLRSVKKSLILAGGKRGVLYAVSTFLEDSLGCRWFAADCSTYPTCGKIRVKKLDYQYVSPFEFRSLDYGAVRSDHTVPRNLHPIYKEFAAHLRINGAFAVRDEMYGGYFKVGKSHELTDTFFKALPPKVYFKEHPEYYSLVGGQRRAMQICLTNPDVIRLATEWVEARIAENPDSKIFTLAQQDGDNLCRCESCQAIITREGAPSGVILQFVNTVAERLEKKYPDVKIMTDAYLFSFGAPKNLKAHPNVAVCIALYGNRGTKPLETHAQTMATLEKWSSICQNLYIYDYDTYFLNFVMTFPNWFIHGPNSRLYQRLGVKGVYRQACPFRYGDMNPMRAYVSGKLLWNPSLDQETLIQEFCDAYYGPAGKHVRAYLKIAHDEAMAKKQFHTREAFAAAFNEIDQGLDLVKNDPERLKRVKSAQMALICRYLFQLRGEAGRDCVELDGRIVTQNPEILKTVEQYAQRFKELAAEFKFNWMGESRADSRVDWFLSTMPRPLDAEIVRFSNEILDVSILPEVGGRIWRMFHRPTGRDILTCVRSRDKPPKVNPDGGLGFYERIGHYTRNPGQYEPYKIIERKTNYLVVEGELSDGTGKMRRTYRLESDKPILHVKTEITNISKRRLPFELYGKAEYAFHRDMDRLYFRQKDDSWTSVELRKVARYTAELLTGEKVPAGAWALTAKHQNIDFAVIHSFDKTKARGAKWRRVSTPSLELIAEKAMLNPGETYEFTQSFSVMPGEEFRKLVNQ